MRTTYDYSPLFRSSIGFDRVFDLLENATRVQTIDSWPPYDIEKTGDDSYRITLAVAGFSPDELSVTQERNLLVVSGRKSGDNRGQHLYHGIAARAFERRFELADHVKVAGARFDRGLLTIELVRELPEAMKPRRITIQARDTLPEREPQRLEQTPQAA
jgi:molecular chaperone IbpA